MRFVLVVAVLAPLALLASLAAASGGRRVHYEGTGVHRPDFKLTLDRHAHTTDWEATYDGPCDAPGTTAGGAYGTDSTPGERPLHVGRDGRFHMHRHYRARISGLIIDIRFRGHFQGNTASGTFNGHFTNDSDGGQTIHCHTGRVHWTAHRK
jgi:hypothetical protein